jgi:hypothetical protein
MQTNSQLASKTLCFINKQLQLKSHLYSLKEHPAKIFSSFKIIFGLTAQSNC